MKIENRQRTLVIVAATALALFLSDRLVYSPLVRIWKARAERITSLTQSVDKGTLLLEREQAIRDRWSQMRTNTLPQNASAAENEVLKAFDRWSQESHISITSIKPQWRSSGDDYLTLECRTVGFGSIQALTRFLYELEKDPLALKVEAVEIGARDKNGDQLTLGLQVSGLMLNPTPQR